MAELLLLEAFYGGSHKQLIDVLCSFPNHEIYTLPDKKWHWRARTSALYFSQIIPLSHKYRVLFSSSVLNLAELVALRPDLASLKTVLYFHENQLVYPIRKQQDRDFQYGYNQIISCLVADVVVFNSNYNKESFLSHIKTFLKLIPDHRPSQLAEIIRPKCRVVYFPLSCVNTHLPKVALNVGGEELISDRTLKVDREQLIDDRTVNVDKEQLIDDRTVNVDREQLTCDRTVTVDTKQLDCETAVSTLNISEHRKAENISYTEISSAFDTSRHKTKRGDENDISNSNLSRQEMCEKGDMSGCHISRCDINETSGDSCTGNYENFEENTCKQHKNPSVKKHSENLTDLIKSQKDSNILHIVWAHRWEHDKDPETFFKTLFRLQDEGLYFHLSVLGECFSEIPDIFMEARDRLTTHIVHWGYQSSKNDYFAVLSSADVSVSTAQHEFFGVSMLESVCFGCYPLCPNRLVYPEIFPDECLYRTTNQLYKKLKLFCQKPYLPRKQKPLINVDRFSWKKLEKEYWQLLQLS